MFIDSSGISYTALGYDTDSWGPVATPLFHPSTLTKIAADLYTPKKLVDFMGNIRPRTDGVFVLLNALGAGEYWGVNKNGDYFPEWSLLGEKANPEVMSYVTERGLPIPPIWGLRTFEMFAYPYIQHNNSDPIHSIGERVVCAAYNDRMHRVELIVFISRNKAADIVQRINDGEPVAWSMGAKLLWDVCSICRNAARKREEYCDHLKNHIGEIYGDGRKVFAYNYFPRFFDISVVRVPADRSAYSLKKVASAERPVSVRLGFAPEPEAAEPVLTGIEKFASLIEFLESGGSKAAAIDKEVPAQEPAKNLGKSPIPPEMWRFIWEMVKRDQEESEPIAPERLTALREGHPVEKILSALTSLGVVLKPGEVETLTGGDDNLVPEGLDFSGPDPTLLGGLRDLVASRSTFDPHFTVRVIKIVRKEPGESPKGVVLVKRSAYEKYKDLLRNRVDLEKVAQAVSHPRVQMVLQPDALNKQIVGIDEADLSFPLMVAPFIASVGLDD